jgi:lysyl-tRNA synthetase, class II
LVDRYVLPILIGPTFLYEYVYVTGGPAREVTGSPGYKQRCELFVAGMEIANVSSPQTDTMRVRKWYTETQAATTAAGWQNHVLGEPYFDAMEWGLPPCATGDLGFDRLLMLLMDVGDIRETSLFTWKAPPMARSKGH